MADPKTAEQLQAELNEAMAKVDQLTGQVRGVSAERDHYRQQANAGNAGGSGREGGAAPHVLGKILGVDADYGEVDKYYVTREQHQRELQTAVNQAYALASWDTEMRFAIRDAYIERPDLRKWDSPIAQRTMQVLTRDGYAQLRRDGFGQPIKPKPERWEDFAYTDVLALQRAAGVAEHELWKEAQAASAAQNVVTSAQGAAGMASGGAPVETSSTPISDEAWMKAAEAGDISSMKDMLKQHAAAVTGQPVP